MASQYSSPAVSGLIPRQSPTKAPLMCSPKHAVFPNAPLAAKEKSGVPPIQTLMDDFSQLDTTQSPRVTDLLSRTSAYQSSSIRSPHLHRSGANTSFPGQPAKTPPSPGQTDPFYTQGELITPKVQLDDTWVTVFGFPSSSASFILQRFSQFGNILSHHVASDGGNWMHVHYESSLQAQKALSRNGKIFPGNVMVGVMPCIDVKIMFGSNHLSARTPAVIQSPAASNTSQSGTPLRHKKPGSIRPLTAAYNAASSDNQVTSDFGTPQKTNGLLTKAMDYIFG
ncbi:nucleoporin NUP35-like isoform X2 [Clavelina lepadiformis]